MCQPPLKFLQPQLRQVGIFVLAYQTLNESFSAVHSHMLYASVIGQLQLVTTS